MLSILAESLLIATRQPLPGRPPGRPPHPQDPDRDDGPRRRGWLSLMGLRF